MKKQKFLGLILIISMFAAMLQGFGFAADSESSESSESGERVAADRFQKFQVVADTWLAHQTGKRHNIR